MKASEILHGLAELLAGIEGGGSNSMMPQQSQGQQPQASLTAVAQTDAPAGGGDSGDEGDKTTMVPPLQQKIELLKKSLNVDNEFDQGFDQVEQEQEGRQPEGGDDLDRMKQMAGIKTVATQELAKDEPLDV